MTSLINIYDNLKSIADRHQQINSFGFGQFSDIATSGTINYPIMYVMPNGSNIKAGEVGYKLSIIVADLVEKGKNNEVDVLSDTHKIACDIIADLKIGGHKFDSTYRFDLSPQDVTMTDFFERFDEEVAGWQFDVTLWADWNWNQCAIPFT